MKLQVSLLILLAAATAHAQEWTRFRGPNGSGVNDKVEVPAVWSAENRRFDVTLPAGGHSSPVLWGDKVFVTCADDQTARRTVLCLSAKDGSVIWRHDADSHTFHEHGDNSYASSTPAVDADAIYLAWITPEAFTLEALDHAGKALWSTNLGPFISQHGGGNSPIIVNDLVLIGDDQEGPGSFLYGVDRKSGKVRWKVARRSLKFSAATPVLVDPAASPLQAVFTSQSEGITAIDPSDGRVEWSLPNVFDSRTVSSPVAGGNIVVATCGEGSGGHVLVAARPPTGSATTAAIAFKTKDASPYVPTPLIKGDLLFFLSDTGKLSCANVSSGKLLWQEKIEGSYYSSPVCAAGQLICVSKKGNVTIVNAGENFRLIGKIETGLNEKCHATPALANGAIYLRTFTHVLCVGRPG